MNNLKIFVLLFLFFSHYTSIISRNYDVYTAVEFEQSVREAIAGDTVYIHGVITLNNSIEIDRNGTEERPIVFPANVNFRITA